VLGSANTRGPQRPVAASVAATSEKTVTGFAVVRYVDARKKIDCETEVNLVAPLSGRTNAPDWDESSPANGTPQGEPAPVNLLKVWHREFAAWIANNQTLDVYRSSRLTMCSDPGESERDFRARIAQLLREERDRAVDELRAKSASKIAVLAGAAAKGGGDRTEAAGTGFAAKLSSVLEIGGFAAGRVPGRRAEDVAEQDHEREPRGRGVSTRNRKM
jgi:hypothetical protein